MTIKILSSFVAVIAFLASSFFATAQEWVQKMSDPTYNFYEVKKSFEEHWKGKSVEKGQGYKLYKRWEWFVEPRVYPSGNREIISKGMAQYNAWRDSLSLKKNANSAGNWTYMGPTVLPPSSTSTAGKNTGGMGRLNCVRFDPGNTNIVWVGSAGGGLWKSSDGGTTFTTTTDNLAVLGVSDIAIDPANSNIMYIATGDADASDNYSIGVLKSIDGGLTWNATGLSFNTVQGRNISRLLINPGNPSIIIAASSVGIYRSTNAGTNWTLVKSGAFKDAELKPGNPSTVYACGTTFQKSIDGGVTFTQVTTGLPANSSVNRMAIAVTVADPTYVYLVGSNNSSAFEGLYRSTDSGTGFTKLSSTPNILGSSTGGTSTGGQGWYDLAITASPTNKDLVIVGGVNLWKSTNGGANWTNVSNWNTTATTYAHADQHDLAFISGTICFAANDGGLFKSTNTGSSWTDMSAGLRIAQIYRLGLSATNANQVITGWQDNGSNLRSSTGWRYVLGGDGMECVVDHTNGNIVYATLYYGEIYKSTNAGLSFTNQVVNSGGTGVDANGGWVTPYIMHPTNASTLIVGKAQLWRTTNGGTNWADVGGFTGTSQFVALAYAPSNPNYIYAARNNKFYVTTDGGAVFADRTAGLPITSTSITYIAVSNTNPDKVWVSFSGYSTGRVYYSSNAGQTWTNYSTGLPNIPVNCIVYQNGSGDGVYAGTDVGAYYRDNTVTSWQSFSTGLPNVQVNELEIHYGSQKIRAATYGRGLWESSLFVSGPQPPPVAAFNANNTTVCAGSTIQFTDQSTFFPTNWNWSFPGGTPSSSTQQNPAVTYNTAGTYNVSLIVFNAAGSDTLSNLNYITINALPNVSAVSSSSQLCEGASATLTASGATFYSWSPAAGLSSTTGSAVSATPVVTSVYTVTGTSNGCTGAAATITISVSPSISINFGVVKPTCNGSANGTATASPSGGISPFGFSWSNGQTTETASGLAAGNYSVTVSDSFSCSVSGTVTVNQNAVLASVVSSVSNATCNGQCNGQAAVSASGGSLIYFYKWSISAGSQVTAAAAGLCAGSHSVTVTDSKGCTSVSFVTITEPANGLTVSVSSTNATQTLPSCNGTATATANGSSTAYIYTWNDPASQTSATATGLCAGTYTVTVNDNSGCVVTTSVNVGFVSIDPKSGQPVMKLYPNPTEETFFLELSFSNPESVEAELRTMRGQVVHRVTKTNVTGKYLLTIDLSGFSSGTYLLRLVTGNTEFYTRVVKQ